MTWYLEKAIQNFLSCVWWIW